MTSHIEELKPSVEKLIEAIDNQYHLANDDLQHFWDRLETKEYDETREQVVKMAKLKQSLKAFIS